MTCCNYERPILDVPVEDVESSAGAVHHHHTSSKAGTPTRTRTAVVFDNGECLPLTSLASAHHDSDEDKFHHNPTDYDIPDTEIMTKEESITVQDEIQNDQLDEDEVAKPVLSVPDWNFRQVEFIFIHVHCFLPGLPLVSPRLCRFYSITINRQPCSLVVVVSTSFKSFNG